MNDRQCVRENAIHAMRNTWRSPVIMRVYAMDVCQRPTRTAITRQRVLAFALRCRMQSTSTGSRGKHDAGRVAKRSTSGLRISPLQRCHSILIKHLHAQPYRILRLRVLVYDGHSYRVELLISLLRAPIQCITALPAQPSVFVLSYVFFSRSNLDSSMIVVVWPP